jgi:uncharacterized protein
MKVGLVVASVFAAIGSIPRVCGAVSFDCSKAQSFREKIVCSSGELSGLDDRLNSAYGTATQTWGNKQGLLDSQRQWIKDTDRCADEACIVKAYRERIAELDGSDAEEGDKDNVEEPGEQPNPDDTAGHIVDRHKEQEAELNRQVAEGDRQASERDRKEADAARSQGAIRPYFSNPEEFAAFYASIKPEEQTSYEGPRLAASLERMISASGGQFLPDDPFKPMSCRERLGKHAPQMLIDFIHYKKSEISNQPPTFFVGASEQMSQAFADSLGQLRGDMVPTWDEPGCEKNAELLGTIIDQLSHVADAANETVRVALKAAYAPQLEKERQLKAEQDAATEKRAEEQRAEQARQDEAQSAEQARREEEDRQAAAKRSEEEAAAAQKRAEAERAEQAGQDEERRQAMAKGAEEQVRIAESQRQAAAQAQAKEPAQAQGTNQVATETRAAVDESGVPTERSVSGNTDEQKEGFLSRLFGGIFGFFAALFKAIFGFFGNVFLTLLWLVPAVFMIQRVRIELQGYVVDPEKDEFSFPGGLISANSVTDYFKIKFITQAFRRFTVRLSDIQSLSAPTIKTTSINKEGNVSEGYSHLVEIRGTFGAATLRFLSEGKRDQLFAALRQANQMGLPVFRSN